MKAVAKSGAEKVDDRDREEGGDRAARRQRSVRNGGRAGAAPSLRRDGAAPPARNIRGRADRRWRRGRSATPKPRRSTSGSATAFTSEHDAEEFQRRQRASGERQRPAGRIGRIVRPLDHLGDVVEEEADEERRDRRDQKAQSHHEADAGQNVEKAVSSHGQGVATKWASSHSSAARARRAARSSARATSEHAAEGRREDVAKGKRGGVDHGAPPIVVIPELDPGPTMPWKSGCPRWRHGSHRMARFANPPPDPLGGRVVSEAGSGWPRRSSTC